MNVQRRTALLAVSDLLARTRLEEAARAEGVITDAVRRLGAPPESDPPDLVVIDLDVPGALETVPAWRERYPEVSFVGFVFHADEARRVEAERLGVAVVAHGSTARGARDLFRPLS